MYLYCNTCRIAGQFFVDPDGNWSNCGFMGIHERVCIPIIDITN